MNKTLLLLVVGAIILPLQASAQIDHDPDGLGVYFDHGGEIVMISTPIEFVQVHAYLLLSRPTDSTGVSGWECSIRTEGVVLQPQWSLSAGMNFATVPQFNVMIGEGAAALPHGDTLLLAAFSCIVMTPADEVYFFIDPYENSRFTPPAAGYSAGSSFNNGIRCQISGVPCASINGTGVVNNDDVSWGSVKAMFN
ncbi:hypothetical protein HN388_06690 [bacterium]|jgi:hypothetical protein|nr:hypothetical protein [bacterium]MBT7310188.1 hypothetical protein [bacterium]